MIHLQLIIVSIAIITNILLGLFVYFRNPKKSTNIFFALMAFSIALWNAGDILIISSKDYLTALFWDRFSYVGALLFPTFSIHFVISIIKDVIYKNWKRVLVVTYGSAAVLLCFIFTPFIIKDVALKPFREVPGSLYLLFVFFFLSSFLYLFYISLYTSYGIQIPLW